MITLKTKIKLADILDKPHIFDMQCGSCRKAFKQRYKTFYDKTIYEVSDD